MGRIQAQIRTSFGEIVIEGESAEDVLLTLRSLPKDFLCELEALISSRVFPSEEANLRGIIEFTKDGPTIISKKKLTHYEAIGLILYASEKRTNTSSKIRQLLRYSGIKAQVSSRLNEMTKRGLVYKPNLSEPKWKLTAEGERWIRERVLPRLANLNQLASPHYTRHRP